MKHLLSILFACLLMTACDIETSDNGDLDGMWQLRSVDTLATGGTANMQASGIYLSVQYRMLEIWGSNTYHFHFTHEGNTLSLSVPYRHLGSQPDAEVTDLDVMRPYGFDALKQSFLVEELNSRRMTLTTPFLRLKFRKY